MTARARQAWRHRRLNLELDSQPDSVALVRRVLTALGHASGWDELLLLDVATAVSEACNNVVRHAYADGHGPLAVSVASTGTAIDVSVGDHGDGLKHAATRGQSLGLGMALISALADAADFDSAQDGTEVRMRFARTRATNAPPEVSLR
jgi:serine/threonine-protein kinase RsbW